MIVMDIPLPKCCVSCPCSYWIQYGEHEGRLMCNAIESQGKIDRESCLVDERLRTRPEGCPIVNWF